MPMLYWPQRAGAAFGPRRKEPGRSGPFFAAAAFGGEPRIGVVVGKAPAEEKPAPAPPAPQEQPPAGDALDELLALGGQFDNIVIQ